MRAALGGIIVPAATPFDADGELDLAGYVDNLRRWASAGVSGYLALGSNGEYRSLSDEESLAVAEAAAENAGDRSLLVGAGRESLRLTLAFVERLAAIGGIDAVAVLTPHYFARSMTDEALVAYYLDLAERSPIPVLVYVAPVFANGVAPTVEAVARLAEHPNICGIKDSSAERLRGYLAGGARPGFAVLAGSIDVLMTCLENGGDGGVVSAANYLPARCVEVVELAAAGRGGEADGRLADLQEAVRTTAGPHSVAGVKACMTLAGYAGGVPRRPVLPVPPDEVARMRRPLERALRA